MRRGRVHLTDWCRAGGRAPAFSDLQHFAEDGDGANHGTLEKTELMSYRYSGGRTSVHIARTRRKLGLIYER